MSKTLNSLAILALAIAFYYLLYRPISDGTEGVRLAAIRGKRVLITGASSGIGEQLAYAYSRLGAVVLLTARRESLLKNVAVKCRELGAERVEYVVADMAVTKDRQALMVEVKKRLQSKQLDHLMLNHAIYEPGWFVGSAQNMTALQRDLQVNFVSYVDIAARCEKMLLASKDGGHIGVVSSGGGKIGTPLLASYTADKHALHGFFSSWRQELRARRTPLSITLFVLGYIKTEMADSVIEAHFKKVSDLKLAAPSAQEAALAILKGLIQGSYEMYFPIITSAFLTVQKFLPGYCEDFLGALYV